jgi:predicted TIM-barrel fold metal-dependent hydrolase
MWGSNWPMQLPPEGPTYAQRLDAVRLHLPGQSAQDLEWILGKTAFSLWPKA